MHIFAMYLQDTNIKKRGFHISCVVVPQKKVYKTYINSVEVHHIWSKSGYEWHQV